MFLKPRVGTPRKASAGTRGAALLRRTSAGRPVPGTNKGASKKSGRRRWLRRLVVWGGSAAIWTLVAVAGLVAWYAYTLPEVGNIAQMARQPSVTLMGADGTLIVSYGEVHGARVSVADLPPHLPLAVLAVEDRRFYQHVGVDFRGLLRAGLANLRAGRIVQGGSTVTQQLAKNLFLTPERTLKRKIQELLLALWLERRFSKDQILSLYLNRVYLGAGTYGVDAAARRYFGKPATEVNLYEAAQLAGLLKAPSRYNPVRDRDRAARRTATVLAAMTEAGFATEAEAARALQEKTRGRAQAGAQARYFADWVLAQVPAYVGPADRDLTVITTLDPGIQRIAEQELAALLDGQGRARGVAQGAVVVLDPDGAVRAMVGGRSYDASQFNRASQALRQPGSAFKPFVYLVGLEDGLEPDDTIEDAPITVEGWTPRNYSKRYHGRVSLREAFARSLNSVAVRVSERVGRARVAAAARRLGITSELAVRPSLALGASEVTLLELTGAYAVFANRGHGVWPYGIAEIRGPEGEVLYRRAGGGPGRLMSPGVVDRMTDLMAAVIAWGSGKAADPGRPAAGKTGTSQDFRDAWFVGFSAELVAGVWLGNDDGAPMDRVSGGSLPAALWGRVVARALEGVPPRPLPGGGPALAEAPAEDAAEGGLIGRILRSLGQSLGQGPDRDAAAPRRRDERNEP
ncbi:MAG: PBP1A family penicillin-binding protein [Kiloniellales bacterium]